MERIEIGQSLVVDPDICHGKMTFKGTRVTVRTVLASLKMGDSVEDILRKWPELRREAVEEAVTLAAAALLQPYQPLLEAAA
jgi:uncharacterized protein (DUF433 family)